MYGVSKSSVTRKGDTVTMTSVSFFSSDRKCVERNGAQVLETLAGGAVFGGSFLDFPDIGGLLTGGAAMPSKPKTPKGVKAKPEAPKGAKATLMLEDAPKPKPEAPKGAKAKAKTGN